MNYADEQAMTTRLKKCLSAAANQANGNNVLSYALRFAVLSPFVSTSATDEANKSVSLIFKKLDGKRFEEVLTLSSGQIHSSDDVQLVKQIKTFATTVIKS